MTDSSTQLKTVWDLPTRLFHWTLVTLFLFSWWSIEYDRTDLHHLSGYLLLALLIFRVVWGVIGSTTARFTHFVRSPSTVIQYTKNIFSKENKHPIGHNPLGGLSVIVMLFLLFAQILLGLFIEDVDGLAPGPLSHLVEYSTNRWAAETHELLFNILLAVIALHLAAISFYWLYKKQNLVQPMLSGKSQIDESSHLSITPTWLALIVFVGICALLYWFFANEWKNLFT